jgi:hypothetical protein
MSRRCHTTYVTTYDSQQEEECEDNFRKSCFIEYETIAFNQTAKVKDRMTFFPKIFRLF